MRNPMPRITTFLILLALFGLHSEIVPAQEAAPPTSSVPDGYLDELKALEGDEDAFVEKLWAMGDTESALLKQLQAKLTGGGLLPEEIGETQRQIMDCANKLGTLAEYGVKRFENNARLHNFYGNVMYDVMGKQAEGVKAWHMAVSLDSKYSNPYNNLGMHYCHTGSYELGFQNMDRALELDPKSPDYCFNMAQNYLIFRPQTEEIRGWSTKKVYKEAMKLSKKAVKLAPDDYELLQDYAVNFLAAENFGLEVDWKESTKAWQEARKHARTEVERFYTWLNEGRAWRRLDEREKALACLKEALALNPTSEITQRLVKELEQEN